jgi:hypothetical protein
VKSGKWKMENANEVSPAYTLKKYVWGEWRIGTAILVAAI